MRTSVSWGIVSLIVLVTLAISFGPLTSHSQKDDSKSQDTKQTLNLEKYPVADYDAAQPSNAAEREERKEKASRYDKRPFVMPNPRPEFIESSAYHTEPVPPALPFNESTLVIIGEILDAKAFMSPDKSAVYSEYTVQIDTVFKQDKKRELHKGQLVSADRRGGRVRYPNGQTILYSSNWQDLPEWPGRYLFFLGKDDGGSPNYKIITAYRLKNGKVSALDYDRSFRAFDGKDESDFIKLVSSMN